jgi:riboflavin kinase/FMN adenylyltransferase
MMDAAYEQMTGEVKKYQGNGRKLGYPTANLAFQTDLKDGVYFGYADLADYINQPTLIFIGIPTTVGDKERRVEAYLLDIPDRDYYGLTLSIRLKHFYRSNQTFGSISDLVDIMKQDESTAREWFKSKEPTD